MNVPASTAFFGVMSTFHPFHQCELFIRLSSDSNQQSVSHCMNCCILFLRPVYKTQKSNTNFEKSTTFKHDKCSAQSCPPPTSQALHLRPTPSHLLRHHANAAEVPAGKQLCDRAIEGAQARARVGAIHGLERSAPRVERIGARERQRRPLVRAVNPLGNQSNQEPHKMKTGNKPKSIRHNMSS